MNSGHTPAENSTTLWAALRPAIAEFQAAGVDSPRLTAEVLMAHVLDWKRARLIARLHDPGILSPADQERFRELTRRRAAGEPLQYLTGEQEFYGLSFHVTPSVLIPRPETEILVEKAVALARGRQRTIRFADIGTGSGCIAVSLAHEIPQIQGWGIDISVEALAVAGNNARRLGVSPRVEFICADLLEPFAAQPVFDLIVSNPPYISVAEAGNLPGHVRDHEPHTALFGGKSGLEIYRRLIPQAAARLVPEGFLLLEVGAMQAVDVIEILRHEGLCQVEILEDLQRIPRCLAACRPPARAELSESAGRS